MPFFIDPQLIQLAEALERNVYRGHRFLTEEEAIEDEDTRQNNKDEIRDGIQRLRQLIDNRIQTGELETQNPWATDGPRYHVTLNDYNNILQRLLPICTRCGTTLDHNISYTTRRIEYGTAYIDIVNDISDHEETDTGDEEGYDYDCSECGRDISPEEIPYAFPEEELEELKELLRNHINNATELEMQPQQRKRAQRKTPQFFPVGKQVQKDIGAHGPNGPQMHTDEQRRIRKGFTEDFAFRNTTAWKCKHCEHINQGTNRKCNNKECKKDKFEPVKDITLT